MISVEPEKAHVAKELTHKQPLIACRFDPKGLYVFASSEDRTIQRWELASGKQVAFPGHDGWTFALAFSPDGQTLLTGGADGKLTWWPATADEPKPLRSIDAHKGWLRSIAVSPDGALVATCGND